MSESFTIHVSRSAFRLRGTATYQGDTFRYSAKSMPEFDEAIIDGAMLDGVTEVVLATTVDDTASEAITKVGAVREAIEAKLHERQDAIREALEALEADGWSRKDAARVMGVNINSLAGVLSDDESTGVHGASVLGGKPADVSGGSGLVLGRWTREGDALVRSGDVRVSGLSARVQKLWASATGYTPATDAATDDDAEDSDDAVTETTDVDEASEVEETAEESTAATAAAQPATV